MYIYSLVDCILSVFKVIVNYIVYYQSRLQLRAGDGFDITYMDTTQYQQ